MPSSATEDYLGWSLAHKIVCSPSFMAGMIAGFLAGTVGLERSSEPLVVHDEQPYLHTAATASYGTGHATALLVDTPSFLAIWTPAQTLWVIGSAVIDLFPGQDGKRFVALRAGFTHGRNSLALRL
jgi:hypothetical protein